MSSKSASLLTQTQRNRIQKEFGDLSEAKMRRDQQRIRERLRSGLFDFQLLADYPDRQFGLTFDTVPEDELRAALANNYIVLERIRELHGFDRAEVMEEARAHTESVGEITDETRTLAEIDLRTAAEIREQTEKELTEQFQPGRWEKRANALMKLGVGTSIPLFLLFLVELLVPGNQTQTTLTLPFWGLLLLLAMCATGWLLIKTAQSMKYNIVPAVQKLVKSPERVIQETFAKLVKNPRKTIRKSWEEL